LKETKLTKATAARYRKLGVKCGYVPCGKPFEVGNVVVINSKRSHRYHKRCFEKMQY
jgi:hypothetical protein